MLPLHFIMSMITACGHVTQCSAACGCPQSLLQHAFADGRTRTSRPTFCPPNGGTDLPFAECDDVLFGSVRRLPLRCILSHSPMTAYMRLPFRRIGDFDLEHDIVKMLLAILNDLGYPGPWHFIPRSNLGNGRFFGPLDKPMFEEGNVPFERRRSSTIDVCAAANIVQAACRRLALIILFHSTNGRPGHS